DGRTLRRRAAYITAGVITLLLLLSCRLASGDSRFVFDWFLTYKKWIDFPLLILLPLLAALTGRPADPSDASGTGRRARVLFLSMLALIILPLTGCGSQTDVEEKSYVLTLYVDTAGDTGADAAGNAVGSTAEDAAGNAVG